MRRIESDSHKLKSVFSVLSVCSVVIFHFVSPVALDLQHNLPEDFVPRQHLLRLTRFL